MITDKLTEEMKDAMKSGDKMRLGVIRMLRAELKNAQIAAGGELSQEAEEKVLVSYAKKRKEAREQALQMGRNDIAEREQLEHDITVSFLPPRLGEEELAEIARAKIEEVGAQGPKAFGAVMKAVMQEVGSKADGSTVSAVVKKLLNS